MADEGELIEILMEQDMFQELILYLKNIDDFKPWLERNRAKALNKKELNLQINVWEQKQKII